MQILCKFPSRGRPQKFIEVLRLYESHKRTNNVTYLVTLDTDDHTVTDEFIELIQETAPQSYVVTGTSTGKIHACNRDMDTVDEWDIVMLASDDMVPVAHGWDTHIIEGMQGAWPDTDGVLYFPDGYTSLNTMCIMGRKYYERFNYIYHPDYTSLWCDNHYQRVSQILNKEKRFSTILFKHEHPANTGTGSDELYRQNEKYYRIDHEVYLKHERNNFGI